MKRRRVAAPALSVRSAPLLSLTGSSRLVRIAENRKVKTSQRVAWASSQAGRPPPHPTPPPHPITPPHHHHHPTQPGVALPYPAGHPHLNFSSLSQVPVSRIWLISLEVEPAHTHSGAGGRVGQWRGDDSG